MRLDTTCARAGPQTESFRSVYVSTVLLCGGLERNTVSPTGTYFRDRLSPVRIRSQVHGWRPKLNVLDKTNEDMAAALSDDS